MDETDDNPVSSSSPATVSASTETQNAKVRSVFITYFFFSLIILYQSNKKFEKRNPIYLFYESVTTNAEGTVGQPGDKHYKCYHGNRKILTITRAMKSSLNGNIPIFALNFMLNLVIDYVGLMGHLKMHFPAMYWLYLILKDWGSPATEEEKAIATGQQVLDLSKTAEYIGQLERASASIVEVFKQQHQHTAVCLLHKRSQW